MRSVAPHRAGSEASQNSWLVEKWKPACGRLTTTTDQTIQMANASVSAGMEIHRLRCATEEPRWRQNIESSGFHWAMREEAVMRRSCDLKGIRRLLRALVR